MKKIFFIITVIILTSFAISVSAAWVEPGCDPATAGPECTDVAAPLNVSSTDQIKAGGLYANFFDAATLQNADGALALQAASGQDIILQSPLSTNYSVRIAPAMTSGDALRIELVSGVGGISISGATDKAAIFVENLDGMGINVRTGSEIGIEGLSAKNVGVQGRSKDYLGVEGKSEADYGVYGNTLDASYYGVAGCFFGDPPNNCGYLGGAAQAGWFRGNVVIEGNLEIRNLPGPFGPVHKGITLHDPTNDPWCVRVNDSGGLYTTSGTCL